MRQPVKIGLLDSGIDSARKAALGDVIDAWKGDFPSYQDLSGHGTACAFLIRQMAPTARLYNLKIFDGGAVTSPGLVLDGIQWCIENGVQVINVSVAVAETGYYHDFAEACSKAAERNIIIVAAADNMGRPCLPAYIKTTFGVGAASLEEGRYYYRENESIQFYAAPDADTSRLRSSFPSQGRGCSFAAARLSGIVAKIMADMDGPPQTRLVQERLAKGASPFDAGRVLSVNEDFDFETSSKPALLRSRLSDQVKEFGPAVLFGSPLDCQLFDACGHLLQFPLVASLSARSARLPQGEKLADVTEDEVIEALARAETLILGHVDSRRLDLASLSARAQTASRNIFSLRPLSDELSAAIRPAGPDGRPWTRDPRLDEFSLAAQLAAIPVSHIPKSQIPALAIVHVGQPRLGRLRIELAIGEALNLAGQTVAQIGSVPYSELFGCAFSHWSGCFSASFPANLRIAFPRLMAETLNHSQPRPTVLVAGCDQSPCPTSFLDRNFFTLYTVPTLSFLFGWHPDAVIAVVDDLTGGEFLDRSLQALRGLLGCGNVFVAHDSQAAAYAAALGASAPSVGAADCQHCQRLKDVCRVPVLCARSPEFGNQAAALVVEFLGLSRDNRAPLATETGAENARTAVTMSGLPEPGDGGVADPLQAAKALAERLTQAGVPVSDQIRAAKEIADTLRQGDRGGLQAAKQIAENLKKADAAQLRGEKAVAGSCGSGADVDPLQAARQIAQLIRGGGKKESFSMHRLRFLIPFLKRQSRLIGASILFTLVASGITLPAPIVQMRIIDRYVPARQVMPILGMAALLVGLYLAGFVAKLLLNYTSSKLNARLLLDLKKTIFERVLTFPISFFSQNQSSYLAARLNEIDRAGTMFSLTSISLVVALLTLVFSATVLAVLDWRVFLIAAAFAPVQYFIVKRFTGGMRGISGAVLEKSANLSKNMQEVFAGMSIVKTFAAERREASKMDAPLSSLFKSSFLQSFALRSSGDIVAFVNQLIFVAVLVASMFLIIGGDMTIGAYVAVVALVERMFSPIQALAATGLVMQPVIVAVNRVADYFEAIGEDAAPGRVHNPPRLDGKVEFRGVAFAYPGQERLVSDVSFTIRPGERVAIVGPNGSGKTTLVKLLLQLHLPDRGSILVDDRDASTLKLEGLRRRIGLVSQDAFLFNDTILANLTYGSASADVAALLPLIEECCPFLKDLPDGVETRVGEGGTGLSGGQRQAVSIVRALLKKPDILIVDEGSTHLDATARETLKRVIENECEGKTCILISHDPDVVATANRVLAVESGRVVEREARQ